MSERPSGAPSSDAVVGARAGERVALARGPVDHRLHRRLRAQGEEAVDEGDRAAAGEEDLHAAVALGGRQVADARDERLGLRAVGDGREHDGVGRGERGVGKLVPQPRQHVAFDVERLRRDRAREALAGPSDRRQRIRERREPAVLRPVAVGGEVDVGQRPRGHERGGAVGRPVRRSAARRHEPGGEGQRRDGRERRERPRPPRPRRQRHAARRRCLRSAKSMITGIPSSA